MRGAVLLAALVLAGASFVSGLRLDPLPEAAARPASGPALDVGGLTDLALVFSGTAPADLPRYRQTLSQWSADFNTQSAGWDDARKAEGLLLFLHQKWKGYSLYQTRLDVLVDNGTYNCVSSAVAYMIMGRSAGLDVQAVATTDHAFALVHLSGRDVDVETTTKYGFDPGTKTEFTDSFGHTGFAYVPPGNYAKRKTIGDRQLLGLLVQNRMADFQRSGDSEDGIGPAIDRWTVEGTPEAFATLVTGFQNYAAWLNGRREYLKGLDLVDKMAVWTGPVPEVKTLAWTFLNNQVNVLLGRKDYAGAQTLTVAWKNKGFLSDDESSKTLGLIAGQQLDDAVQTQPYADAAGQIEAAFGQGAITAARRQELLSYVYGRQAQTLATEQGPRAAVLFLKGLPAEVAALPAMAKALSVFAYNWSVDVHNRFAGLWNAGKKDDARQTLRDALAEMPDSQLLKKDLVIAQ
jgi:hypothetical protein